MYSLKHEFPKGYKQYRVLDLMVASNGLTYSEIIKFAFELGNNHEFTENNRGYWSGAFVKKSGHYMYGSKVNGWITRYCVKGSDGKYRVGVKGHDVLEKLEKKFKGVHTQQALNMKQMKQATVEPKGPFKEMTMRIICTNDMVPPVIMRGLQLGDKVSYYSKNGNKSGIGYVFSITEFAPGTGISTMMKVRDSLTNILGFGMELHYDSENDKFMDGIKDCEIIKI